MVVVYRATPLLWPAGWVVAIRLQHGHIVLSFIESLSLGARLKVCIQVSKMEVVRGGGGGGGGVRVTVVSLPLHPTSRCWYERTHCKKIDQHH